MTKNPRFPNQKTNSFSSGVSGWKLYILPDRWPHYGSAFAFLRLFCIVRPYGCNS